MITEKKEKDSKKIVWLLRDYQKGITKKIVRLLWSGLLDRKVVSPVFLPVVPGRRYVSSSGVVKSTASPRA